ncbi:MAG: zinc dependent phospholipase C family protein [Bacteroidota bacterium]|nr:zinc dependent phospholipase C family protein [Bacteroidota bacterium]
MKSKILSIILIVLLITESASLLFAWGEWGHKHINRGAVFALPNGMIKFYYNHIDYITEASVVPDLRRGVLNDRAEPPRHYIDIEDFGNISVESFPKTTKEAYIKYDSNFLNRTGYLPWYIQNLEEKLTQAFKKRSKSEILFISAELGHYVGDAHMPLHTSSNYNGQLTNQKGVHALWESTLPQLFGSDFNFNVDKAKLISDIPAETWNMIAQSHALVSPLLKIEKENRDAFNKDDLYKKDDTGHVVLSYNQPVFSDEYARSFNKALGGMVEQQLRLSIKDVADYWYTAWINAGSPELLSLDDSHLTKQNAKNFKREFNAWNKGKLLNLSNEKEE